MEDDVLVAPGFYLLHLRAIVSEGAGVVPPFEFEIRPAEPLGGPCGPVEARQPLRSRPGRPATRHCRGRSRVPGFPLTGRTHRMR